MSGFGDAKWSVRDREVDIEALIFLLQAVVIDGHLHTCRPAADFKHNLGLCVVIVFTTCGVWEGQGEGEEGKGRGGRGRGEGAGGGERGGEGEGEGKGWRKKGGEGEGMGKGVEGEEKRGERGWEGRLKTWTGGELGEVTVMFMFHSCTTNSKCLNVRNDTSQSALRELHPTAAVIIS